MVSECIKAASLARKIILNAAVKEYENGAGAQKHKVF